MKVKCFGMAKDITEASELSLEVSMGNVGQLRRWLMESYPSFSNMSSFMIAVNQAYADDETLLNATDEIAIIPPVSGG